VARIYEYQKLDQDKALKPFRHSASIIKGSLRYIDYQNTSGKLMSATMCTSEPRKPVGSEQIKSNHHTLSLSSTAHHQTTKCAEQNHRGAFEHHVTADLNGQDPRAMKYRLFNDSSRTQDLSLRVQPEPADNKYQQTMFLDTKDSNTMNIPQSTDCVDGGTQESSHCKRSCLLYNVILRSELPIYRSGYPIRVVYHYGSGPR
jgi:hypothetical protein